jgi:hypothetical protein
LTLAAARCFTAAFDTPVVPAPDRFDRYLYNAACAAVLSSAGQRDAHDLEQSEREKWREQAHEWLSDLLSLYVSEHLAGEANRREAAVEVLRHWQTDPDLATVRDDEHLAQLPAAERPRWERLWQEVAAELAKATTEPAGP